MALPSAQKKDKRPIPDPVEFLQSRNPNGGRGPSNPMSPGQSGGDMPTQTSGAPQGFGQGPKKKEPQGNKAQSGHRKGKIGLAPTGKSKAKPMVNGKTPFNMPTNNAIVRRLHPPAGPSTAGSAVGQQRNGVLSHFAGFGPSSLKPPS